MKKDISVEQDLQMDEKLQDFSKPTSRRDIRSLAFHLIYAMDRFDYQVSLEEIIQDFQDGFEVEIEPNSYAVQLSKGVISLREDLDEKIKPLLKNWKLERLGVCTRLILRMALWELMQPDSVSSIIINEAIELTKAFAEKDAFRFVNGILDEACKKYNLGDGSEKKLSKEGLDGNEEDKIKD